MTPVPDDQVQHAVAVVSVVRFAEVLSITPQPERDKLVSHGEEIIDSWRTAQSMEAALGSLGEFHREDPDAGVETHWEHHGNTLVLDFPVLNCKSGNAAGIGIRLTVAICGGELSTKVWARVGRLVTSEDAPVQFSTLAALRDDFQYYEKIAKALAHYGTALMRPTFEKRANHVSIVDRPSIEVVAVSSTDNRLKTAFSQLAVANLSLEELLADRQVRTALLDHFMRLPCGPPASSDPDPWIAGSPWYCVPVTIETTSPEDGLSSIETREVLFFDRFEQNTHWFVGVGYDDTRAAKVATRASVDAARILAETAA